MGGAEQRVSAVIKIASRLIEIMNSEINVLRDMRIKGLDAYLESKTVTVAL